LVDDPLPKLPVLAAHPGTWHDSSMTAPSKIVELVERFREHNAAYLTATYNETLLRDDFLDPLFNELGWDLNNTAGYAQAYRDVVKEESLRTSEGVKAPDFTFRIGGVRKFFVEAKKPSAQLSTAVAPAYQLRRYAWSAKLPLSILTNFREFAVYDTRSRPEKDDKASKTRVFYCKYDELEANWDWIKSVFSKEAILKGSFDKYADDNRAKRGTAEVDEDFLGAIEGWRNELAHNLALRNASLTEHELNFAVQRMLDRIVFLRICEDRGIETYGKMLATLKKPGIYGALCNLFVAADARYNSGIFHFRKEKGRDEAPDQISLGLKVDDKVLKSIISNLYYPAGPYEFSVISADILGQVYEQFIGKVIRLTTSHKAIVEDKPAVRKSGGVYYTPSYIVDFMVSRTLNPSLAGKTPRQIAKLRVLDPACGSGADSDSRRPCIPI
jgi:predicted type IV restriction endonuclease